MLTSEARLQKRLKPLERAPADGLLIHEIFASIQGESSYVGQPCTFVRTTACNLRCTYCDTRHAFVKGEPWSLAAIEDEVARLKNPLVEITGGEPLLQPNALELMTRLCDKGHQVLLETSGSLDISAVDARVVRILDVKTPSSGEEGANLYSNLDILRATDEVKFVIGSREDYVWSRSLVQSRALLKRCTVLFGTVFETISQRDLAEWIIADQLQVRMQLQMHKYIWDPEATGV